MDKTIGILTTFDSFDPAYSLCTVVTQQMIPMLKKGYKVVLYVVDGFNFDRDAKNIPEGVEVRKIPQFLLVDYPVGGEVDVKEFDRRVKLIIDRLLENAKDIDVMITHDIIFQSWFLPYNAAIREVAKMQPMTRWLHWVHSAPSPRPGDKELFYPHNLRFTLPPNSKLVYLNDTHALYLAEMYGTWLKAVRVVYNQMDARQFFNFHPLTEELIEAYELFSADVLSIYPVSTPRMEDGKQVSKVMKVLAKMKDEGKTVRLVICNAHANAAAAKEQVREMQREANEMGLGTREVIFTSFHNAPKWEQGVPHEVIRDLFRISNVFIFPSKSENNSLILLEAALSKNLLVLNESFPPMKDIVGARALYFKFGSLLETVTYNGGEENYYRDVAKIILAELNQNRNLLSFSKVLKDYNYDAIFTNQIEPLFYEQWT
jgi:glycosyltransferase involved in cell wall biosynthesis